MTIRTLAPGLVLALLIGQTALAQDDGSDTSSGDTGPTLDLPLVGEIPLPGFLSFLASDEGGESGNDQQGDGAGGGQQGGGQQSGGPGGGQQGGGGDQPTAVIVTEVLRESVGESFEFIGRVAPIEQVSIRARVAGYVEEVMFEGGESVEAGEPLFRIEPDRYEAALASAEAQLSSAMAQASEAERALERSQELRESNTVAQAQLDDARASYEAARAEVEIARAAVRQAELDLQYTTIEAAIDGQISEPFITVGNYVSEASSALAEIIQLDPIWGVFPIGENRLITWRQLGLGGGTPASLDGGQDGSGSGQGEDGGPADGGGGDEGEGGTETTRADTPAPSGVTRDVPGQVRAGASQRAISERSSDYVLSLLLPDGSPYAREGAFAFVSNTVDTSTGSVQVRIRFPNDDELLLPNQNVTLLVAERDPQMLPVIPQSAIQLSRDGRSVWVVNDDDTVTRRMIEIEPQQGQTSAAVTSGLEGGELIVVRGAMTLSEGATVQPQQSTEASVPGSSGGAGGSGQGGEGQGG